MVKITEIWEAYRRILESNLQRYKIRGMWYRMTKIKGFRQGEQTDESLVRINELNAVFNRFSSVAVVYTLPFFL